MNTELWFPWTRSWVLWFKCLRSRWEMTSDRETVFLAYSLAAHRKSDITMEKRIHGCYLTFLFPAVRPLTGTFGWSFIGLSPSSSLFCHTPPLSHAAILHNSNSAFNRLPLYRPWSRSSLPQFHSMRPRLSFTPSFLYSPSGLCIFTTLICIGIHRSHLISPFTLFHLPVQVEIFSIFLSTIPVYLFLLSANPRTVYVYRQLRCQSVPVSLCVSLRSFRWLTGGGITDNSHSADDLSI